MNRRSFLKLLGIGSAATYVAPMLIGPIGRIGPAGEQAKAAPKPAYSFMSDGDTGLYRITSGEATIAS